MRRQCEANLDTVLECIDGWPRVRKVRCGQGVGIGVLRAKDGTPHYFCREHYGLVDRAVARDEAVELARRDAEDDARAERLHAIGREAARRAADRSEELRSWGGKYAGWHE